MNLQGLGVNIVRNKYEYEKYVDEDYCKQYDWEASKGSMPWLVLRFSKTGEYYSNEQNKVTVSFSAPEADFNGLGTDYDTKGFAVVSGDKTKFNFDLGKYASLMLEAKKDCGLTTVPANLTITAEDSDGNKVEATLPGIDLTDKDAILERIDKECIQQGDGYLARLLYEIVNAKL